MPNFDTEQRVICCLLRPDVTVADLTVNKTDLLDMSISFVIHPPVVARSHATSDSLSARRASKLRDGGVGTTVCLNRLLFESGEVTNGRVNLPVNELRATHVSDVLRLKDGDQVRAGVLDDAMYDNVAVSFAEKGIASFDLANGVRRELPEAPKLSLLLAVPRPKVLTRLLPQIAAVGVCSIGLVNAYRVERCYFDAHLLRNEQTLRNALVTGLMQAGCDARVPFVHVAKRLKVFLEDELDGFAPQNSLRLLAHPGNDTGVLQQLSYAAASGSSHVILAIGPEGGWMPREVSMFRSFGFSMADLGNRVVRTDAAVLMLMGIVHEWQRMYERQAMHPNKLH